MYVCMYTNMYVCGTNDNKICMYTKICRLVCMLIAVTTQKHNNICKYV
jgi:hypothetical protein